jgi:hypothetical protein
MSDYSGHARAIRKVGIFAQVAHWIVIHGATAQSGNFRLSEGCLTHYFRI